MKNLLFFLLILTACQKQEEQPSQQPKLQLTVDLIPAQQREAMRTEAKKPSKPPGKPIKNPPPPPPDTVKPATGATVVLVDGNGHESVGNDWAFAYGTNGVLYSPQANVTEAQIDYMIEMSNKQYLGYNILFTKDEALFNAHTGKKTRIILTSTDVLFPGASGVAFTGSNGYALSEVFVFTENLFNLDRYMFRIVVHEMGHAAGLNHQSLYNDDCTLNSRYRYGYKMGYDWDSEDGGIFGYGTSYACNIFQDDNLILAANLGTK